MPNIRLLLISIFTCLTLLSAGCSSSGNSTPTEDDDPTNPDNGGDNPDNPGGLMDDPENPGNTEDPNDPDTPDEPIDDPNDPGTALLVPSVEEGSDLERLILGINRQVSSTLLDLNTRLSSGIALTPQQDECLGAFDPAAGQQLLSIECQQPLFTDNTLINVTQASYFDTEACNSAIFNNGTGDCLLQSARISIPTEFVLPEPGMGTLPIPSTAYEIFYAQGDTILSIQSAENALTGLFRCDLDLTGTEAANSVVGPGCASVVESAANRIDTVVPVQ